MKVNNNIVAVFEIIDGKIQFLGLSKNFEEDYKITTVTTNREIYYKKLDDCNENELKLIPDSIRGIWLYKYDRLLNDSLYYFFTITKDYDINYEKSVYYVANYMNLIFNDDLPDLLLHVKKINKIGLAVYFYDNYLNADNFDSYYERDGVKYKRVKVNSFAEFKKIVDEYFKKQRLWRKKTTTSIADYKKRA